MWAPITYFKGTLLGGMQEGGTWFMYPLGGSCRTLPHYMLSAYAHGLSVIMVMCPFEIGSRLPLLLCSSPILEFLFWDNLKS